MKKGLYKMMISDTKPAPKDIFERYAAENKNRVDTSDEIEGLWNFQDYEPKDCWENSYDCSYFKLLFQRSNEYMGNEY